MDFYSVKGPFTLKDKRRKFRTSVKLVTEDGRQTHRFFRSVDISTSGISLSTEFPLDLGTPVVLDFMLPQTPETVRIAGEVIRHIREEPRRQTSKVIGMGVKFRDIQPAHVQVLKGFVQGGGDATGPK